MSPPKANPDPSRSTSRVAVRQGPLAAYRALRAQGKLDPDPSQLLAAEKLQALANALSRYRRKTSNGGWMRHLGLTSRQETAPLGLYLCGPAGRGKSMLMDLFFAHAALREKRRVHFHAFMLEVHERIHRLPRTSKGDSIAPVAQALAEETTLLCFDEFHVTDIADAMILGRLFEALLAAGVVIVATSNFAPDELYKDGLKRELFLPFIALIKERLDVLHLGTGVDWRRRKLKGMRTYLTPLGAAATAALDATFATLTDAAAAGPDQLIVLGRRLTLARAASGVLRSDFAELCQAPLGPADYVALAQHFRAVVIDGIPRLAPERRNEARRLITLIDELYEHRVHLVCAADAEPDQLCPEGPVAELFRRAASRLIEMQTADYLTLEHLT